MDIEGGEFPWLLNIDEEQLSKFKMDLTRCMRDYNNTLDAKFKMAEETKVNNSD